MICIKDHFNYYRLTVGRILKIIEYIQIILTIYLLISWIKKIELLKEIYWILIAKTSL